MVIPTRVDARSTDDGSSFTERSQSESFSIADDTTCEESSTPSIEADDISLVSKEGATKPEQNNLQKLSVLDSISTPQEAPEANRDDLHCGRSTANDEFVDRSKQDQQTRPASRARCYGTSDSETRVDMSSSDNRPRKRMALNLALARTEQVSQRPPSSRKDTLRHPNKKWPSVKEDARVKTFPDPTHQTQPTATRSLCTASTSSFINHFDQPRETLGHVQQQSAQQVGTRILKACAQAEYQAGNASKQSSFGTQQSPLPNNHPSDGVESSIAAVDSAGSVGGTVVVTAQNPLAVSNMTSPSDTIHVQAAGAFVSLRRPAQLSPEVYFQFRHGNGTLARRVRYEHCNTATKLFVYALRSRIANLVELTVLVLTFEHGHEEFLSGDKESAEDEYEKKVKVKVASMLTKAAQDGKLEVNIDVKLFDLDMLR